MHHAVPRDRAPSATLVALLLRLAVFVVGAGVITSTGWLSSTAASAVFINHAVGIAAAVGLALAHRRHVPDPRWGRVSTWFARAGLLVGGGGAVVASLPRLVEPPSLDSSPVLLVALAALASSVGASNALDHAARRLEDDRRLKHEVYRCLVVGCGEYVAVAGIWLTLYDGILWAEPAAGALVGLLMLVLLVTDVRAGRRRS